MKREILQLLNKLLKQHQVMRNKQQKVIKSEENGAIAAEENKSLENVNPSNETTES